MIIIILTNSIGLTSPMLHTKSQDHQPSLFVLIVYLPSTIFQLSRDRFSWVEPVLMPRLHLPRSWYYLFVDNFLNDFFGIVGSYKLRRMCLHCLQSPYDFFRRQTRTKPWRPCGYCTTTARLSYNHRVIFTTSLYKSHDASTMTLHKSQGVGTPAVQLSHNYVHGFKRVSMFIFALHLNFFSNS